MPDRPAAHAAPATPTVRPAGPEDLSIIVDANLAMGRETEGSYSATHQPG